MAIRLWVAALALGAFVLTFLIGGGAGVTIGSVNGVGTLQASTSVASLFGAALIAAAYVIALTLPPLSSIGPAAKLGRRAAAWFVDFVLSLAALSAVLALLPLTIEALATGHYQLAFERSSITAIDWIVSFLVVGLAFVGMAFYWALPVLRETQTVGQCVVGVRVMSATEEPLSFGRVLLRGFLQPFAPVFWLGKLVFGAYWPDAIANTSVVRVFDHVPAAA